MKCQQVRLELEKALQEGRYRVGACLPPQRELARSFNVSLSTLQQSLAMLEEDGLISREHGRGTFVRRLEPMSLHDIRPPRKGIAFIALEHPETGGWIYKEGFSYRQAELRALDSRLAKNDRHLVFAHTSSRKLATGKLPKAVEQDAVAGVILDGYVRDFDIECFKGRGLAVVVMGEHPVNALVGRVSWDGAQAAYLMTKALLSARSGPVYFATEPFRERYTHALLDGYRTACHEADQDEMLSLFASDGDGEAELRRMIERTKGPFGLLLHYNVAHLLVDLYREYGLDLTDHPVAIFGYADYVVPEVRRKLNVCTVDVQLGCGVAVEIMEALLAGQEPETVVLTPELTSRREDGLLQIVMSWRWPEDLDEYESIRIPGMGNAREVVAAKM
ncbi:MAG: GntR family transcriptional regulator [Dehalococcoidia bacterium]|nr:GntR family transcriptional regulator [Dehalococcoidia bacterium]